MSAYAGKLAIVTGSAVGIGSAIAKRFVNGGLTVVGMDIRDKHELNHENYHPVVCDMSCGSDIIQTFNEVKKCFGPVHVLVNNAGILANTSLICGDSDKLWQTCQVNIMGLCTATKEGVAQMKEHQIAGHVVQFSSILGHFIPKIPFNIYTATKHAVRALSETLRLEFADEGCDIKVCTMCPGVVDTHIFTVNEFNKGEGMDKAVDESPKLKPEDIAEGVWFMIDQPCTVNVCTMIIRPLGEKL